MSGDDSGFGARSAAASTRSPPAPGSVVGLPYALLGGRFVEGGVREREGVEKRLFDLAEHQVERLEGRDRARRELMRLDAVFRKHGLDVRPLVTLRSVGKDR